MTEEIEDIEDLDDIFGPEKKVSKSSKASPARLEAPAADDIENRKRQRPVLPEFGIGPDIMKEMAKHSAIYASWALWLTSLQESKSKIQARLDVQEAAARESARESLRAILGKAAITETAVKDAVMKDRRIRSLYLRIENIEQDERLARAVINSLDVKTKMLQSIAGLKRSEIETLSTSEM
jgi:alkanesulfonate monooxygenase SsuD/methylene tetrahydromethanopterin reductase-like flavin-dependent oxidoreductase (luciferase family)